MFWTRASSMVGGPLLVVALLAAGLRYDLFHRMACYDLFLHALGGIVVAAGTAGLVWQIKAVRKTCVKTFGPLTMIPLGAVLLVSLLWEAGEVLLGMTPNWTQSVGDTLSDLMYALGGAVLILCVILRDARRCVDD